MKQVRNNRQIWKLRELFQFQREVMITMLGSLKVQPLKISLDITTTNLILTPANFRQTFITLPILTTKKDNFITD